MESILNSIKELLLGSQAEHIEAFDKQIIMHINTVLMELTQIGIGPEEGFVIEDDYAKWTDFIPEDGPNLVAVTTYVYLKVRLLFDPPQSQSHLSSIERRITELEWRLNHQAEAQAVSEEE